MIGDSGLQALTLQQMLDRFAELAAAEVILGNYKFDAAVQIKERAASATFTAAYGQLWIKSASPAELWFADDAGAESQVMIGAAGPVAEVNDLSAVVTWANIPQANVPDPFLAATRGTAAAPYYSFTDDPTDGIYSAASLSLAVALGGVQAWRFLATGTPQGIIGTGTGRPLLANVQATQTVPNLVPYSTDFNTGIGGSGSDALSLIAGGVEGLTLLEISSGVVQSPDAAIAVTAFATGGQTNAVQLNTSYTLITVCATGGDSVKLPPSFFVNALVHIRNNGAAACDVFPGSGDDLGKGANTAESLAAGDGITYIATVGNTTWAKFTLAAAVSDPLLLDDGTAGAPSYSFASGPTTGFYVNSPNQITMSISGAPHWTFATDVFQGAAGGGAMLVDIASTATTPVYRFSNDIDTGIGRSGTDALSLIAGGVEIAQAKEVAGANQFIIAPGVNQDNESFPSLAFGDGNSGFYESSDNVIGVTIAGDLKFKFGTTFSGNFEGPDIIPTDGSVTSPVYRFAADINTGLGRTTDLLSMIAGGVAGLQIRELNSGVLQIPAADVAITAFATGGQANAVALKQSYNVLSVVAAGGDSVKLPPTFTVNSILYIKNDGANSADVFPASGDDIGAGADTAVAVLAGDSIVFIATTANATWTQLIVSPGAAHPDPHLLGDGSNTNPTYAFSDDVDTGMYTSFDNVLAFTAGGVAAWKMDGTQFVGFVGNGPKLLNEAATITNPTLIPHAGDTGTGIGGDGAVLSLIQNSIECIQLEEAAGVVKITSRGPVLGVAGTNLLPTFSFSGDPNTGMYSASGDVIMFATGGVRRFFIDSTKFTGSVSGSGGIIDEAATFTNPTLLPATTDLDSGIGSDALDTVSIIAGGVECLRFTEVSSGILHAPAASIAITALAGGGQGGAGILTFSHNVISVAASAGDSVTLPASFAVNTIIHIKNDGASAVDVFPGAGDDLGQGADTAESLAVGRNTSYIATTANTTWTNMRPLLTTTADPLLISLGLVGAPSYSFTGDADTGVWSSGADILSFAAGGLELLQLKEIVGASQVVVSPGAVINDAVTPVFAFGDGNTGFYESADNVLQVSIGGTSQFNWSGTQFRGSTSAAPAMLNETATSTNPTLVPNVDDVDSGLGWAGTNELTFVAGSQLCMSGKNISAAPGLGFYTTAPIIKQLSVAVTSAGIHAALVNLGLIT